MPYFETEVDVDPSEFLDSCSGRELKEVVDWIVDEMEKDSGLREHFHNVTKGSSNVQLVNPSSTTAMEMEFMDKLESLKGAYYRMDLADQEDIEKLFTKYVWY